jgi:hypothetical protein
MEQGRSCTPRVGTLYVITLGQTISDHTKQMKILARNSHSCKYLHKLAPKSAAF